MVRVVVVVVVIGMKNFIPRCCWCGVASWSCCVTATVHTWLSRGSFLEVCCCAHPATLASSRSPECMAREPKLMFLLFPLARIACRWGCAEPVARFGWRFYPACCNGVYTSNPTLPRLPLLFTPPPPNAAHAARCPLTYDSCLVIVAARFVDGWCAGLEHPRMVL